MKGVFLKYFLLITIILFSGCYHSGVSKNIHKKETKKIDLSDKVHYLSKNQFISISNIEDFGFYLKISGKINKNLENAYIEFENPISNLGYKTINFDFSKNDFSVYLKKSDGNLYYGMNLYTIIGEYGNQKSIAKIISYNDNKSLKDEKTGIYYPKISEKKPRFYEINGKLQMSGITNFLNSNFLSTYWHYYKKNFDETFIFYSIDDVGDKKFRYYYNYYFSFGNKNYLGMYEIEEINSELDIKKLNEIHKEKAINQKFSQEAIQELKIAKLIFSNLSLNSEKITDMKEISKKLDYY